jgi:hypothetical protein
MQRKWLVLLLILPFAAQGQDCVGNVDSAGNVCTAFTLGLPTTNCIPVLTQDGQAIPQYAGAVCPSGFYGGASLQITLPNDPVTPGNALSAYSCTTEVLSNTVPVISPSHQPAGSLVQGLTCTVNYGWYTATWNGTLTYDYSSVLQRHCNSGRGAVCKTNYYPVMEGGSGEIATPPPPPPPPPPPQPIVYTTSLKASPCDTSYNCTLAPADTSVITGAMFGIYAMTLHVDYADGTADDITLDFANVVALDDDGTPFVANGDGSVYDADGNLLRQLSVSMNGAVDEDTGRVSATGGTITLTIMP